LFGNAVVISLLIFVQTGFYSVPSWFSIGFRVLMPPGKSWIFLVKFPGPGKSWKMDLVLESPGNISGKSCKVLEFFARL